MNFLGEPFPATASLFPAHRVVKDYLHNYGKELETLSGLEVQFQTQVISIDKQPSDNHQTQ